MQSGRRVCVCACACKVCSDGKAGYHDRWGPQDGCQKRVAKRPPDDPALTTRSLGELREDLGPTRPTRSLGPRFSDSQRQDVKIRPIFVQTRPRSAMLTSKMAPTGRIATSQNCTFGCGESEKRGPNSPRRSAEAGLVKDPLSNRRWNGSSEWLSKREVVKREAYFDNPFLTTPLTTP